MGSRYEETTIGDTCYVTDGAHAKVERQDVGVPYLTSKNVGAGRLTLENVDYIKEEDFDRLFSNTDKARRRLQAGDVLIGIIGTFGNAYRYKESDRFGVSSAVAVIRPNQEILNSDFLLYVVTSATFKAKLSAFKSGSVQGYTNLPTIRRLPFVLPPIRHQEAIAHILGTLDEKIELNRRMNETLESMARALFKSWFVDFDPVIDNALAAGNAIPEPLAARAANRRALGSKRKPLPENIQKLFPVTLTFNEEMGWIPEGWEVDSIRNRSSNVQYGFTQSSSEECVGPRFLRITDIRGGQVSWQSVPFCVASADEIDKYRIVDGDVLVARTGASTGENTYIVSPPEAVFASYLVRFQFASHGVGRYVGQFMRTPAFFNYVTGSIGGSAQPNASAQTLGAARCVFPSIETSDVFYEQLRSADLKRARNEEVSESLTKLRDTLLPKLLSGELRIPAAEKLVAGSV